MGSGLVRLGVRQHARPESLSKRAPQPLGHLSPEWNHSLQPLHNGVQRPIVLFRRSEGARPFFRWQVVTFAIVRSHDAVT